MSTTITAQIARLLGPRQLVFEEQVLVAENLGPQEVLAETICSAISPGTELAAYLGEPPLRPGPIYPRVVGYCNVAEVKAVGLEVKDYQPGDRILSFQSHRSAFSCPAEKIVLKLPATADAELAATTYLFHLGYNALLKGGFTPGHKVSVVGLGMLGLGTVALAANSGGQVTAYSEQADARTLATDLGAQNASTKSESSKSNHATADLVISTSNRWDDWLLCLQLARKEGTIAVLGFPGRGQAPAPFNPLDSQYFYDKQLRVIACGMSPDLPVAPHELRFTVKRNCEFLLGQILAGKLAAEKLIGQRCDWAELPAVYDAMSASRTTRLTTILRWK
ncbi:MAG: zinc-dependent alcohol dehydrogenase [Verrucomicrobiota bacterium]